MLETAIPGTTEPRADKGRLGEDVTAVPRHLQGYTGQEKPSRSLGWKAREPVIRLLDSECESRLWPSLAAWSQASSSETWGSLTPCGVTSQDHS